MAAHLRVFPMTDDDTDDLYDSPEPSVHVRVGDLLPLVAMAQRQNFIWLKDFLDDEVSITQDLHQVLQTLRGCRPSA